MSSSSTKTKAIGFVSIFALVLWSAFALLPVIWMLLTSIKSPSEAAAIPPKLLFSPDFSNYLSLLVGSHDASNTMSSAGPLWKYLISSLIVALGTTALCLVLGTCASFYLSRGMKQSSSVAFWILSFRMMPPIAVIVPFSLMISGIGLSDSRTALVLCYTMFNLPICVWIITSFMNTVPREYDEMASLDGYSLTGFVVSIMVPLVRPALLTAGVLIFIFSWNEFLFALILTGFQAKTLPVVASGFITQRGILWGQLTATATIMLCPVVILFSMLQRKLLEGFRSTRHKT